MQALFEFLPLLLFLGAYFYKGIYFALGVLMVAMPIGLAAKYVKTRKLDRMYMWSTILLLIAGALTFYFDNPVFVYWKPSVLYWAVAAAFIASLWIGSKPLVRRFIDMAGELPTEQLAENQWRNLNVVWSIFFAAMGAVNIYVAYNFPEEFWVKFKVFGLMGFTIVFMLAQSIWIFSKMDIADEDEAEID